MIHFENGEKAYISGKHIVFSDGGENISIAGAEVKRLDSAFPVDLEGIMPPVMFVAINGKKAALSHSDYNKVILNTANPVATYMGAQPRVRPATTVAQYVQNKFGSCCGKNK